MKKQTAPVEEKGECAPLWIISFADMISLLMAFFIMLMTMSTANKEASGNEGEGIFDETLYGFRKSIATLGVPELFGGKQGSFGSVKDALSFDSRKVYYSISDGNDTANRTIDAHEERIRRLFNRLERRSKTFKPQIYGSQPDFIVAPIVFGEGQVTLDESARQFLNNFIADLYESSMSGKLNLYVVGLAPQETSEKQRWLLSAKRAQAVANFLTNNLPPGTDWSIYSWGAGSGGDWVKKDGPISEQSQILISVLRVND